MDKVLVVLFGICILIYIFRYDLKVWWYAPFCQPCQRYTRYFPAGKEESEWLDPEDWRNYAEHYACLQCGRTCDMEDAFRWKF